MQWVSRGRRSFRVRGFHLLSGGAGSGFGICGGAPGAGFFFRGMMIFHLGRGPVKKFPCYWSVVFYFYIVALIPFVVF